MREEMEVKYADRKKVLGGTWGLGRVQCSSQVDSCGHEARFGCESS